MYMKMLRKMTTSRDISKFLKKERESLEII